MQAISQPDIESLRRRINRHIEPSSGAALRSAHVQVRTPQRPQLAIEGEEQVTSLGRFLLQGHFYPNSRSHGSLPISRLQSMPAHAIGAVSDDDVQSSDPKRWIFLDTETTGLAGGTGTCAFLVGVGMIEADGFRVQLFFMRDFDEEPAMLQALAQHLSDYDTVITFNGKAYDVPLLETRYRLKRQRNPFARMGHVDLLHPARRLWKDRLPDCRLSTVESEVLGVERQGDVPGALIPQRYFDHLRTGDAAGLGPVFHHNVLDIVSLACLGSVLLTYLDAPEKAPLQHGEDLRGLARWVSKLGDDIQALELYRKAIQAGLPASGLFPALWESAQMERRAGHHSAQVQLLRDLSRVSNIYRAAAFVELAKHYEHREKDLERALQMTRSAQRYAPSDELHHRELRIQRKMKLAPQPSDTAAAAASDGGSDSRVAS